VSGGWNRETEELGGRSRLVKRRQLGRPHANNLQRGCGTREVTLRGTLERGGGSTGKCGGGSEPYCGGKGGSVDTTEKKEKVKALKDGTEKGEKVQNLQHY